MAGQYTWQNTRRRSSYRLPNREHVGRFVLIALVVAVVVHAALYFWFGRLSWRPEQRVQADWESRPFAVEQVQIESEAELLEPPESEPLPEPELEELAYDEVDLLDALSELQEVDISPQVSEPENLFIPAPALEGLPDIEPERELVKGAELADELEELAEGTVSDITEIPDGQLVVDPGEQVPELVDPDAWNQEQLRQGFVGGDPDGLLKNFSDLDDLIASPIGSLGDASKPAMLGSDLLFDFNQSTLREGAHLSLMKLGALIARHEQTFFIIEGHTDSYGSDAYNRKLGLARAQAVKDWLMEDLGLDGERILVKSAGASQLLVKEAGADKTAQQINRRVEIHMRQELPAAEPVEPEPEPEPRKAQPVEEAASESPGGSQSVTPQPEPSPRKAVLVRPRQAPRAVPVEPEREEAAGPARAVPVE